MLAYKMSSYRKKSYRKYGKKKAPARSRYDVYGTAGKQLWKDVKWLKDMINVEEKYKIKDVTSTSVLASFDIYEINDDILRGTGAFQRDGASCKGTMIQVRGRISYNPLYAAGAQTVRLTLVGKNVVDGNTCDPNSVFATAVGNNPCLAWYEPNEMTGYRILKDKKYTVTADRPDVYFKFTRKIDQHTEWNVTDATGVVANMTKGLFCMFVAGDATTNYPTIEFSSKYKFVDN